MAIVAVAVLVLVALLLWYHRGPALIVHDVSISGREITVSAEIRRNRLQYGWFSHVDPMSIEDPACWSPVLWVLDSKDTAKDVIHYRGSPPNGSSCYRVGLVFSEAGFVPFRESLSFTDTVLMPDDWVDGEVVLAASYQIPESKVRSWMFSCYYNILPYIPLAVGSFIYDRLSNHDPVKIIYSNPIRLRIEEPF